MSVVLTLEFVVTRTYPTKEIDPLICIFVVTFEKFSAILIFCVISLFDITFIPTILNFF